MRNATPLDTDIATLVHDTIAVLRGPARFGDRKVFISALWAGLQATDSPLVQDCTIDTFKAWLLKAFQTIDTQGVPLVVMARADLVAAMDSALVADSELHDRHGISCWHFVVDRVADAGFDYRRMV